MSSKAERSRAVDELNEGTDSFLLGWLIGAVDDELWDEAIKAARDFDAPAGLWAGSA